MLGTVLVLVENFRLTETAEEGNPPSRAVKAHCDWMCHGLVHVGAVIFR